MATLTYKEFKKLYPNDGVCLSKLFTLRFGHLKECPACNSPAEFRRVRTRKCYHCVHCYLQLYPMQGTFFENTHMPLTDWFYIMHLFTTTRNGVAAKEIERAIGCTYKTAFRICHQVRKLMEGLSPEKLSGFVEIDETFNTNGSEKNGTRQESTIFGMVERSGNVKAFKVGNIQRETLFPIIEKHVEIRSKVSTDENAVYNTIDSELKMQHGTVKHSAEEYKRGWITTNTIEGYFSQIKRAIYGTYLHVSDKYIENYVSECTFRYNNRKQQEMMFELMIANVGKKEM